MCVATVGIVLVKQVFQVKSYQVLPFFANFQGCLIGMEACGGANF
jgi:hypothetical protein